MLNSLVTNGGTALGPGLLASVAMAAKGKPGSKVIICTDGEANAGVGRLINSNMDTQFYDKVGAYA